MKFDARLTPQELACFQKCLHLPANGISFERASFKFPSDRGPYVEALDKMVLSFQAPEGAMFHLELVSLFDELVDVALPDQGKLAVSLEVEPYLPLQARLEKRKNEPPQTRMGASVYHHTYTRLVGVRIYGSRQSGLLNELDPDITLEYVRKRYGLEKMPFVICESVEFIVLEHENGYKTIIRLESGGFMLHFGQSEQDVTELCEQSHRIPGHYYKNIVLQHEIR